MSLVLARAQELQADRFSAEVSGARNAADALIATRLQGRLLRERFWTALARKNGSQEVPPSALFAETRTLLTSRLEPDLASRWVRHAVAETALGYTSFRPPSDSFPLAREAAVRALQLDPRSAEAEAALAYTRLYFEWDWPGAEAAFQRATRLDPSSATAHHWYSVFLTARGRFHEAAREIAEARRLDPLSPAIATDVGFELYYAGKYAPAVTQLQEVLRTAPGFPLAHLWLGRTYQAQRAWPAALGEYAEVDRVQPDWPVTLAAMGHVLGVSGQKDQARAILGRMERLATSRYVTPYGVALVHAGLGDADGAFQWLSRAVDDRSHWLVWLSLDPRFADLRGDPRFAAVLQRMGW
jgi:tetratricopeptide (TPR) repeat protein